MTHTMNYVGTLVVETCWCGISHAVPQEMVNEMRRQQNIGARQTGIYCPLGHIWTFGGTSEAEKLRREVARKQAELDQQYAATRELRRDIKHRDNVIRAERGAKTKLKKRVAAGVCPCCHRNFSNMARHMKSQHPEFGKAEA